MFKTGLMDGTFDFSSDTTQTYKIALYTNQATLNESTTAYTSNGEVSGAGYTSGGNTLTISTNPTNVNNVTFLSFANSTWSSATFTARGALIYKADGSANPAVCVLDFGSDKTVTNQTFTVTFPASTNTSAIIRIA